MYAHKLWDENSQVLLVKREMNWEVYVFIKTETQREQTAQHHSHKKTTAQHHSHKKTEKKQKKKKKKKKKKNKNKNKKTIKVINK